MEEYTTIQLTKKTRDKLKTFRITKRESYEELINRLMNNEQKNLKDNTNE